jgi:hypothetical protein
MLPDHAVGNAAREVFRLRVMRTCRDQFIGTGCFDVVNEPDIHFGLDCMDWGGSLYRIGGYAMAFGAWQGAIKSGKIGVKPDGF